MYDMCVDAANRHAGMIDENKSATAHDEHKYNYSNILPYVSLGLESGYKIFF